MAGDYEITRRSKLFDVLKAYPFLEEQVVQIAPPFKNLRNPVLRRTVGQLATVEQVAQIGGIDPVVLVNTLRRAAGLGEGAGPAGVEMHGAVSPPARAEGDPAWIKGEPAFVVNGTELLEAGEVPLEHVNLLLRRLPPGGYILLATEFEPTPIIEAMQKQARPVHHTPPAAPSTQHYTYIGG